MASSKLKPFLAGVLAALLCVAVVWPVLADPARQLPLESSGPQQPTGISAFDAVSPHVIPAAAFAADGFNPASVFFSFGGGYFTGNTAAYGCLQAPVYLPSGVPVRAMFVSVYDNDPGRSIAVNLRRVDNFTGTVATMGTASTTSSGAAPGIQVLVDDTIAFPEIRHPDFSYFVTACLGSSSLRLYSVRLRYGYDLYIPFVRKS